MLQLLLDAGQLRQLHIQPAAQVQQRLQLGRIRHLLRQSHLGSLVEVLHVLQQFLTAKRRSVRQDERKDGGKLKEERANFDLSRLTDDTRQLEQLVYEGFELVHRQFGAVSAALRAEAAAGGACRKTSEVVLSNVPIPSSSHDHRPVPLLAAEQQLSHGGARLRLFDDLLQAAERIVLRILPVLCVLQQNLELNQIWGTNRTVKDGNKVSKRYLQNHCCFYKELSQIQGFC